MNRFTHTETNTDTGAAQRGEHPTAALDRQELARLQEQLKRFDLAALSTHQHLAAGLRSSWGQAAASQLAELVQSLSFQAADRLIEQKLAASSA